MAPGREEEPRNESFDVDMLHDDEAGGEDELAGWAPSRTLVQDASALAARSRSQSNILSLEHSSVKLCQRVLFLAAAKSCTYTCACLVCRCP